MKAGRPPADNPRRFRITVPLSALEYEAIEKAVTWMDLNTKRKQKPVDAMRYALGQLIRVIAEDSPNIVDEPFAEKISIGALKSE